MKKNKIEKQLKTLVNKMPEPKCELLYNMPVKQPFLKKRKIAVKLVTMVCTICLLLFCGVFTVNAEFRELVISFLKLGAVEEVPGIQDTEIQPNSMDKKENNKSENNQNQDIQLLYSTNMEDILSVEYLESDGYMTNWDGLFYYENEEGRKEFYQAVDGEFVSKDLEKLDREVTIMGITGRIDYSFSIVDDSIILYENNLHKTILEDGSEAVFSLEKGKNSRVYLKLYINPQVGSWSYPVRYDVKTGIIEDFLADIQLGGTELSKLPVLMDWYLANDDYAIVTAGTSKADKELYLINLKNKSINSINSVTGLTNVWGSKILDNKLFVLTGDTEYFDYISYDFATGDKQIIYEDITKWIYDTDNEYSVIFTGGRYDLVQKEENIYLADEMSGKLKKIEGITEKLIDGALINKSGDKILVSNFGDDFIKQIGILDINKNIFYLFDRKGNPEIEEYSISWQDNDTFAINAADKKQAKHYVYLYSLNE